MRFLVLSLDGEQVIHDRVSADTKEEARQEVMNIRPAARPLVVMTVNELVRAGQDLAEADVVQEWEGVRRGLDHEGQAVFLIPSDSCAGMTYTVCIKSEHELSCTCPSFKFRRQPCKHVRDAYGLWLLGRNVRGRPGFQFANIPSVEVGPDGRVSAPLLPVGDAHFMATVCYDLLRAGVDALEVRRRLLGGQRLSLGEIVQYVRVHGRKVGRPPLKPLTPYLVLPADAAI